jgi:hypothetical protein
LAQERARTGGHEVLVEGMAPSQLLDLRDQDLDALLFSKERIVFSVGSAEVLGGFRVHERTLVVELGHVDGGGEGVLRVLWLLARRYARRRGIAEIDWLVHAVHCPHPNLKLRRVLERRGFTVEAHPVAGQVYRLVERVGHSAT